MCIYIYLQQDLHQTKVRLRTYQQPGTYPFGKQKHSACTLLILFRKFITPRLFSYSSFRICYGCTIDEICSLHLVSLL